MFDRILIANRGEIACRVIATARDLGIGTVAVYSDADARSRHVHLADEAWRLGPAAAAESYLNGARIIDLARRSGAQAIHPGYGFLAENAQFAEACTAAGLVFIGPPAAAIRAMGMKDAAKALMVKAGVPVVPGYGGTDQQPDHLLAQAEAIGWPVLIKPVAGGGGKGMRRVDGPDDFRVALDGARREAASSFGDDRVLLEKYIQQPRHIEIQIFFDQHGNGVHLFERDCSLQRRHQKVVEEAPAPAMPRALRDAMGAAAITAARAVDYVGAGTVEFIVPGDRPLSPDAFWFLEMNTRLQVEHPVTEMITGQDLVAWQFRVAAGGALPMTQADLVIDGHAMEARLYAEDPARDFMPATGRLRHLAFPDQVGTRIDAGVGQGDEISVHYDPMIAKLIAHGADRDEARRRLRKLLADCRIDGCTTNRDFLLSVLDQPDFVAGRVETGLIDRHLSTLTGDETAGRDAPPDAALAAATLHALGALGQPRTDDPWDQLTGFRLWEGARHVVHLSWRDEIREVAVSHEAGAYDLDLGGHRVTGVRVVEPGRDRALLDLDGRRLSVAWTMDQGGVTLFMAGARWRFGLPDQLAGDDATDGGPAVVKAPLPGRVTALHVALGQPVARGEVLLVLEAMKMEHGLSASRDGVVAELRVSQGDQVEEGDVMLILAEEADD